MVKFIQSEALSLAEAGAGHPLILIFNSIHRVLRAEKALLAAGVPVRLVQTPRPLVSDCGMAIVLEGPESPHGVALLKERAIQVVQIFADMGEAMAPVSVD